jgi:hypothetical protein
MALGQVGRRCRQEDMVSLPKSKADSQRRRRHGSPPHRRPTIFRFGQHFERPSAELEWWEMGPAPTFMDKRHGD